MLSRYKDIFKDGLVIFNSYTVSLRVKPDTIPKFCKHRPVPIALRTKVEEEIERLVKNRTLVPVDHSEWATPVVPIVKNNGSVRLCGDFKTTVNPALVGTEYPLPKIEHLYVIIAGANYFSKIDLKDAYQQLVLDSDSQLFTTINTIKGLFMYTRVPSGLKSSAGRRNLKIRCVTIPAVWEIKFPEAVEILWEATVATQDLGKPEAYITVFAVYPLVDLRYELVVDGGIRKLDQAADPRRSFVVRQEPRAGDELPPDAVPVGTRLFRPVFTPVPEVGEPQEINLMDFPALAFTVSCREQDKWT
ncbi:hypothetical protein QTP88_015674 [Uroleucon formosanum]